MEARDTNERTALYLAAGRGHMDVVQYLIAAGANVNGEEIHGMYLKIINNKHNSYKFNSFIDDFSHSER